MMKNSKLPLLIIPDPRFGGYKVATLAAIPHRTVIGELIGELRNATADEFAQLKTMETFTFRTSGRQKWLFTDFSYHCNVCRFISGGPQFYVTQDANGKK